MWRECLEDGSYSCEGDDVLKREVWKSEIHGLV